MGVIKEFKNSIKQGTPGLYLESTAVIYWRDSNACFRQFERLLRFTRLYNDIWKLVIL